MKLYHFFKTHPVIFFISLTTLIGLSFYSYKKIFPNKTTTQYITKKVEKGTLTQSISATGQVASDNQVDLKPEVSGKILNLRVKNGQDLKTGDIIAQIDATDALKNVRDAQNSLESAQLSLEKLTQASDQLSLLQAKNNLEKSKEAKQTSQNNLDKDYEDSFNNISNTFLDLPTVMSGLQNILYSVEKTLNTNGQANVDFYSSIISQYDSLRADSFKNDAISKYASAKSAYDSNFNDYKIVTRFSSKDTIEKLLAETYETTKKISEAVKSSNNLIQLYVDKLTEKNLIPATLSTTHLNNLNTYTGLANSHLSSLLASQNALANDKQALVNADRTIEENQETLLKLQTGADPLDIKSSELTIKLRQDALTDARISLSKYTIRAPFDGTLATLLVEKGASVSSGSSLGSLIAKQQIAQISLNEVDVAKIKLGQKAILNFDAIDALSLTGTVAQIDTLGTTSQGVVSYTVKIAFDTQDNRIKPGMSVSASIITEVKQDILLVPNSAVKTQNGNAYVEILENGTSAKINIQTGLANDTSTEIISGLTEGQEIITQTISAQTTTSQTQTRNSNSILPIGGNAFRATGAR
jgi:RND family efflux transporter MFP subunit